MQQGKHQEPRTRKWLIHESTPVGRAGFARARYELADYSNTRSFSATVDRLIHYELIDDDVDGKIGQPGYAPGVIRVERPVFAEAQS